MKEVTKDEFYNVIGNQDACINVSGKRIYTCTFNLRHGRILGKTVESYTDGVEGRYPIIEKYYVAI